MLKDSKAFSGFSVNDLQTLGLNATEDTINKSVDDAGPDISWLKDPAGNISSLLVTKGEK